MLLHRSRTRPAPGRVAGGRPPHPHWCGGGHLCTVDRLGRDGQHRSVPYTVDSPAGPLILTRVSGRAGERIEVRAVLTLPTGDDPAAQRHAARLVNRMVQALDLTPVGGAAR